MAEKTATAKLLAHIRVSPEEKKTLARAAEITSQPMATFVRSIAVQEARKIVADQDSEPREAA